jgi:hypothetical protein
LKGFDCGILRDFEPSLRGIPRGIRSVAFYLALLFDVLFNVLSPCFHRAF